MVQEGGRNDREVQVQRGGSHSASEEKEDEVNHLLLAYATCGVWIALVIATVDLLTPKKPPMGALWTLVMGALWPFFLGVAATVLFRRYLRS